MRRVHTRPRWLLLLLWGVVGAVSVPSARPAPAPAHEEASCPALSHSVVEVPVVSDTEDVVGDVPLETSEPGLRPEVSLTTDPTRAGPLPRPGVAFALHQRPPPVVTPA